MSSGHYKILAVDDDPAITELVQLYLTEEDCDVLTAQSGKDALRHLELDSPDIVLTDISMPDMEGIELIRAIRRSNKQIPIIVMSGNVVGSQFFESARVFGAKASIRKPFGKQELVITVHRCLSV